MYTDGITEAASSADDEFGESRLIASIHRHHMKPAQEIVGLIVQDVKSFSAGEQLDDITLIVCKGVPR